MAADFDPREELQTELRRAAGPAASHPSPTQLGKYQGDELSPQEESVVREHLVACGDCAALVLELTALRQPGEDSLDPPSDLELAAAWQRQRGLLAARGHLGASRRPTSGRRLAWAAAASLAFMSLFLGFQLAEQKQANRRLSRPRVNPPLASLDPLGSIRSGPQSVPTLKLPGQAGRVWLILHPLPGELAFPRYRVRIISPQRRTVLTLNDLQASDRNTFRLELPSDLLEAGEYRVLLEGQPGDASTSEDALTHEYRIRFTAPLP